MFLEASLHLCSLRFSPLKLKFVFPQLFFQCMGQILHWFLFDVICFCDRGCWGWGLDSVITLDLDAIVLSTSCFWLWFLRLWLPNRKRIIVSWMTWQPHLTPKFIKMDHRTDRHFWENNLLRTEFLERWSGGPSRGSVKSTQFSWCCKMWSAFPLVFSQGHSGVFHRLMACSDTLTAKEVCASVPLY